MRQIQRINYVKESIRLIGIGCLCIVFVVILPNGVEKVKAISEKESIEYSEEVIKNEPIEDEFIQIDFENINREKLNEVGEIELLLPYFPGNKYLKDVKVERDKEPIKVNVLYESRAAQKIGGKEKYNQWALLVGCLILGVDEDVDSVGFRFEDVMTSYAQTVYRVDVQRYLGASFIAGSDHELWENRIVQLLRDSYGSEFFTRVEEVGEKRIETFFKENFPLEGKSILPTYEVDEVMERQLLDEYGYKLYIEGLKYENKYVKIYSAKRLIEYIGTEYVNEILVELGVCKAMTDDDGVEEACLFAMELLGYEEEERVPYTFRRSLEGSRVDGEVIYLREKEGIRPLLKWQGKNLVDEMQVLGLSETGEYVIFLIKTYRGNFVYSIKLEDEVVVIVSDTEDEILGSIYKLLEQKMNDQHVYNPDLEDEPLISEEVIRLEEVVVEWLGDVVVSIQLGQFEVLYNVETKKMILCDEYMGDQNYDMETFLEDITLFTNSNIDTKSYYSPEVQAKVTEVYIEDSVFEIYEYDSYMMCRQFISKETRLKNGFTRGKLLVQYQGEAQTVAVFLEKILEKV